MTIRNIDDGVKERLRVRAARHGRSMEAELRCILGEALEEGTPREANLAESIRSRFAALGGVELAEHPRVAPGGAADFDGR